jgi:hypothetical protein
MKKIARIPIIFLISIAFIHCGKSGGNSVQPPPPPVVTNFNVSASSVNGSSSNSLYYDVSRTPSLKFSFPLKINRSTVTSSMSIKDISGTLVNYTVEYENSDSVVVIKPTQPLNYLSRYVASISNQLKSNSGGSLLTSIDVKFQTSIDSSRKFALLSDDALLTLIQRQTFKYFWDFAHPVSGLARERNTSGDIVTSGGSGFGIMAIVTAISRNFVTRAEGLARMQKIVGFLKNNTQKFHGAFPHWLNGSTGVAIPFSQKDNGADLVETSYLMQGLLIARQYFNSSDVIETSLRNDINALVNGVDWNFFRKSNENVLYWHWSQDYNWEMNHKIQGWNECLITYVLAASSPTYSIPKIVYENGWALNGGIKNNNSYYDIPLPLGPSLGGPLFFAHYSFLGINPNGLTDAYANYQTQNKNHTLINYSYTKANPKNYFGYSDSIWGLTASDIPNGYAASSPTNDLGVIAPTAALSSFPYTPNESMQALKFYYYVLGDKIWKDYGFIDAFSLHDLWFADSFLAIDQGPIIIMIENYRSGLLWNLFTSCPEIKNGLRNLGFQAPYL